jgi:hypothetical protein
MRPAGSGKRATIKAASLRGKPMARDTRSSQTPRNRADFAGRNDRFTNNLLRLFRELLSARSMTRL